MSLSSRAAPLKLALSTIVSIDKDIQQIVGPPVVSISVGHRVRRLVGDRKTQIGFIQRSGKEYRS